MILTVPLPTYNKDINTKNRHCWSKILTKNSAGLRYNPSPSGLFQTARFCLVRRTSHYSNLRMNYITNQAGITFLSCYSYLGRSGPISSFSARVKTITLSLVFTLISVCRLTILHPIFCRMISSNSERDPSKSCCRTCLIRSCPSELWANLASAGVSTPRIRTSIMSSMI